MKADRLFALLLLVVALVRLALLFGSQYHTNGDDAAIGVMAQRILEGETPLHPSLADRHAGSALAGYVAAGALAAFGVSEAALKVPSLFCSLLALVLLYSLVRAVRGGHAALLVAALYGTSVALMKWSFYSAGGYVVCQALFSLVLWLLLARVTVPGRARPAHDVLIGLLCGLGVATLVLFAPAAATAAVFLLVFGASGPLRARASRFLLAFLVGCGPLLLFDRAASQNAPHSFLGNLSALVPNLWAALTRHWPAMNAFDNIDGSPDVHLVPNVVACAVVLAGLAILVVRRGPALVAFLRVAVSRGEVAQVPVEAPVLLYLVSYLALYAVHPFAGGEARHLLPLEPGLSILAGLGLFEALARPHRAPLLASVGVLVVAAAFGNSAVQHARLFGDDTVRGPRGALDHRTAPAVAALLEEEGVRHVVTDDWDLAWRMSFHTRGRIVGCHALAEHKEWLADESLHRTRRYAVVVRAASFRDRALERRVRRADLPAERHVIREKAVHVLGPPDASGELPDDWCPPHLLLEPVSPERARATR